MLFGIVSCPVSRSGAHNMQVPPNLGCICLHAHTLGQVPSATAWQWRHVWGLVRVFLLETNAALMSHVQ